MMDKQDIVSVLDNLAAVNEEVEKLRFDVLNQKAAIMATIQPEIDKIMASVKPQLDEAEGQFQMRVAAGLELSEKLDKEARAAVIELGASVKGTYLHAVYSKGRVTWDGKKLDGMMSLIPELRDARKEGEPSVAIRKV
jgi:hypothetical protein